MLNKRGDKKAGEGIRNRRFLMKMNKRGQVTLYIIIAIVIVAAALFFILFLPRLRELGMSEAQARQFLEGKAKSIQDFARKCVKDVSMKAFNEMGMHAGYYYYSYFPQIDFAGNKTVVVYRTGGTFINRMPSNSQIESEFSTYLEREGYNAIDNCTKGFSAFKRDLSLQENKDKRLIKAKIRSDDILITIKWPITISKAKASMILQPQDVVLLIPLNDVLTVANDIANSEAQGIPFEAMKIDQYIIERTSLLKYVKFDMQAYPSNNQNIIFIESVPSRVGEEIYRFYFAINRA